VVGDIQEDEKEEEPNNNRLFQTYESSADILHYKGSRGTQGLEHGEHTILEG
jgi:hypothetical protein